ncbi:class I SAM-dependent methyltransferase [Actinoallomurus iriomotensis]|uniref:Methyltransferase n=1 Tax=Actinoallomurus iriomotensis TaxID=478107 RepID=A0A9W6RNA3_9ACTN|nr:class I SAM-dependent methyltransferase [Actinoallomurus iriomotensis]GLY78285.1 methyltransferase [Actinoallomurus iriomotensis]
MTVPGYDELVVAAMAAPSEGWDFEWVAGRCEGSEPSWSYRDLARAHVAGTDRLLDMDTGGGELLASLGPLPPRTWATEGWPPNISVARRRLEPLGVTVVPVPDKDRLPLPDASVGLVLNRHGSLAAHEVRRVLRPGGVLLTQQVGSEDCADLNEALGASPAHAPDSWTLRTASKELSAAGLRLTLMREEHPVLTFYDIGAVIYHLRMVAWQIPDFSVERYDASLRRLHQRISAEGRINVHAHRFLIAAERPIPSACA